GDRDAGARRQCGACPAGAVADQQLPVRRRCTERGYESARDRCPVGQCPGGSIGEGRGVIVVEAILRLAGGLVAQREALVDALDNDPADAPRGVVRGSNRQADVLVANGAVVLEERSVVLVARAVAAAEGEDAGKVGVGVAADIEGTVWQRRCRTDAALVVEVLPPGAHRL